MDVNEQNVGVLSPPDTAPEVASGGTELVVDARALTGASAALAGAFVAASLIGQTVTHLTGGDYALAHFFNVDEERNAPTFFAVGLLLLAATLLGVVAALERGRATRDASHWAVLALGFFAMAFDESCMVHERLVNPTRRLFGGGQMGVLYYAWVIPYAALVLALVPYFLGFLARLPGPTRCGFVAAGALYLGGALGVELAGGRYMESYGYDLTYDLIATTEECLELAGIIVFNDTVVRHAAARHGVVGLRFLGARG